MLSYYNNEYYLKVYTKMFSEIGSFLLHLFIYLTENFFRYSEIKIVYYYIDVESY